MTLTLTLTLTPTLTIIQTDLATTKLNKGRFWKTEVKMCFRTLTLTLILTLTRTRTRTPTRTRLLGVVETLAHAGAAVVR